MLCCIGEGSIRRAFVVISVLASTSGCAVYNKCDPTQVAQTLSRAAPPPAECRVDGCTLAPDFNFLNCCNTHDTRYWAGGTAVQRRKADLEFRQCVADADHEVLANIYYVGVRIAGTPFLPTPWRWGFGWEYPRGYK